MHPALVPFVAVTSIYYLWRAYRFLLCRRERQLRDRITYMMWIAAQHVH